MFLVERCWLNSCLNNINYKLVTILFSFHGLHEKSRSNIIVWHCLLAGNICCLFIFIIIRIDWWQSIHDTNFERCYLQAEGFFSFKIRVTRKETSCCSKMNNLCLQVQIYMTTFIVFTFIVFTIYSKLPHFMKSGLVSPNKACKRLFKRMHLSMRIHSKWSSLQLCCVITLSLEWWH